MATRTIQFIEGPLDGSESILAEGQSTPEANFYTYLDGTDVKLAEYQLVQSGAALAYQFTGRIL